MPRGVVLQRQWIRRGRLVPHWVAMSDIGLDFINVVPDRVGVSDVRLVGYFAVPARSVLPSVGPGAGCVVSVWLVQPVVGHERIAGVHALCTGFVCIAG